MFMIISQYTPHSPQTAVVEAGRCWLIVPAQVRQDVPSKTLWTRLPTPASFSRQLIISSPAQLSPFRLHPCAFLHHALHSSLTSNSSQKSRERARSHALSRLGHPSLPEGLRRAVQGVQDSLLCRARRQWWRSHGQQWYVRHNTAAHAHRTSTNMPLQ
jgi:hypothetical protein